MYNFYVLMSLKDGKLYKGYSENIASRFITHNSGGVKSTKFRRPFVLIHLESFNSKIQALEREKWTKSLEGGTELKRKLKNTISLING